MREILGYAILGIVFVIVCVGLVAAMVLDPKPVPPPRSEPRLVVDNTTTTD